MKLILVCDPFGSGTTAVACWPVSGFPGSSLLPHVRRVDQQRISDNNRALPEYRDQSTRCSNEARASTDTRSNKPRAASTVLRRHRSNCSQQSRNRSCLAIVSRKFARRQKWWGACRPERGDRPEALLRRPPPSLSPGRPARRPWRNYRRSAGSASQGLVSLRRSLWRPCCWTPSRSTPCCSSLWLRRPCYRTTSCSRIFLPAPRRPPP
jgi:hypothetical protein